MKFVCEGSKLSLATTKVCKALPSKTLDGRQILDCIKIDAYGDKINLFATDGEMSIMRTVEAEVIEEGSIAVPGKFLQEFVDRLGNDTPEFTISEQNRMRIRYTDSEVFVQCFESVDFPKLKTLENPRSIRILQKELKELVNKTVFCVATGDTRAVLKGVLLAVEDYQLSGVALDGYRMMRVNKPIEQRESEFSVICPARTLSEISKLMDNDNDIATIYFEGEYIMFETVDTKLVARLLNGDFINYKQLIPESYTTEIIVPRETFGKSLARASVIGKSGSEIKSGSIVTLSTHENVLTIKGNSELGNITENIGILKTGKDITITFNTKYLMDYINSFNEEYTSFRMTSPIAPCTIAPETETDKYLYLVLPIRLIS